MNIKFKIIQNHSNSCISLNSFLFTNVNFYISKKEGISEYWKSVTTELNINLQNSGNDICKMTSRNGWAMAFNFSAFSYIIALIVDAFLIFFSLFHVIAFDELKTDYKNPIDQCNSLNPVSRHTINPKNYVYLIGILSSLTFSSWFSQSIYSICYSISCLPVQENGFR